VVVRPPSADDADEFVARMRASRRLHAPWISMPQTHEAFAAYLERARRETSAFFLAHRRDDDAIVGFLNLSEIVRGRLQSAFLGYGAVAEFAGRGYLTEAMHLVLREAFTRIRLHRLEANIQPGNLASIELARRCGFRLEGFSPRYLKVGGRWRDHERWAITREEWRESARKSVVYRTAEAAHVCHDQVDAEDSPDRRRPSELPALGPRDARGGGVRDRR
jgi:[ribosomal protein S5]-alanine N-acetyltransferase